MARQRYGSSGPPNDRAERIQAWVERSCAEQGVPVKITDRAVLLRVAELLRERPAQSRQNGRKRDSSKRL
jgi:hypothetical protein